MIPILRNYGFVIPDDFTALSRVSPAVALADDYFEALRVSQMKEADHVAPVFSALADLDMDDTAFTTAVETICTVSETTKQQLDVVYDAYSAEDEYYSTFPGQINEDRVRRDRIQNLFYLVHEAIPAYTEDVKEFSEYESDLSEYRKFKAEEEFLGEMFEKFEALVDGGVTLAGIKAQFPEVWRIAEKVYNDFDCGKYEKIDIQLARLLQHVISNTADTIFSGLKVLREGKKIRCVAGAKAQLAMLQLLSYCVEDLKGLEHDTEGKVSSRTENIRAYVSVIEETYLEIGARRMSIEHWINEQYHAITGNDNVQVDFERASDAYNRIVGVLSKKVSPLIEVLEGRPLQSYEIAKLKMLPIDEAWAVWVLFDSGKLSIDNPVAIVILQEICGLNIADFKALI